MRSYLPKSLNDALEAHLAEVDPSPTDGSVMRHGAKSELVTKLVRLYMAGQIPLGQPRSPEPNEETYGSLPREHLR